MPHWLLKASIQKAISFLPASQRVNYFFQRYVSRQLRLTEDFFEDRLAHCAHHLQAYSAIHARLPQKQLELGTGWYPIVPIGMYVCGLSLIWTLDIRSHIWLDFVKQLMDMFVQYEKSGRLVEILPERKTEKIEQLSQFAKTSDSATELLAKMGIHLVVEEASKLSLPSSSIDLVSSNNTFEHIPTHLLGPILMELRRILRKRGVMSHYIDMVDHYAYFDSNLSPLNFLKYSAREWTWIENSLQSQNRMRISEYRQLYERIGLPIFREINESSDSKLLQTITLDPAYQKMSEEDLLVAYSQIISIV